MKFKNDLVKNVQGSSQDMILFLYTSFLPFESFYLRNIAIQKPNLISVICRHGVFSTNLIKPQKQKYHPCGNSQSASLCRHRLLQQLLRNPMGKITKTPHRFSKNYNLGLENWKYFEKHLIFMVNKTRLLLKKVITIITKPRAQSLLRRLIFQDRIFTQCLLCCAFLYVPIPRLSLLLEPSHLRQKVFAANSNILSNLLADIGVN